MGGSAYWQILVNERYRVPPTLPAAEGWTPEQISGWLKGISSSGVAAAGDGALGHVAEWLRSGLQIR